MLTKFYIMKILPAVRLNSVTEYYFSKKLNEIDKMRKNGREIINLGIGSPDLPPDEKTTFKLVKESLKSENHSYQSYTGVNELRNSFSRWYKNHFNVSLDADSEILPLIGSKEGIMHISMAFLNPLDKVLVPNPGYPTYAAVSKLVGAEVVYYDLIDRNNWYPDFDMLCKMDLSGVKIMWVNYPNMPSGANANKNLFENLISFGIKNNILVVNDNPYSFILNNKQLSILEIDHDKEIALELNSLSKSHNMAGWRVGMLAGNADYIKSVLQVKSNMDSGMFKPIQSAASEALLSGNQWYNDINKIYAERREIVYKILDKLKFEYYKDQVGMFVWAKICRNFESSEHFSDLFLKREKVFITPGSVFGSNGDRYIRISLCNDTNTFRRVLRRTGNFVSTINSIREEGISDHTNYKFH